MSKVVELRYSSNVFRNILHGATHKGGAPASYVDNEVCIYVYKHIYIVLYIYIYVFDYIYIYIYICIYYSYIYIYIYCTYIYNHLYGCVCLNIHMLKCIHIHTV